jgi:hypothetical protein
MNMPLQVKALVAIAIASGFAVQVEAKCALDKTASFGISSPRLLAKTPALSAPAPRTDSGTPAADPTAVGLWNIQILSDGQVIDSGFDAWHADGTETLNDTTPPAAGAVCLGIWSKVGPLTYQLKHPSWLFDDANVNLIGIAMTRETVVLDQGGNSYTGKFTVDAFDLNGNRLSHFEGAIRALRITTDEDPNNPTGLPGFPVWPQLP